MDRPDGPRLCRRLLHQQRQAAAATGLRTEPNMRKWLDNPKEIAFEVRDRVAYITLNWPEKRNAITVEMLEELRGAMLEADDLTAVRCIVLQGAGKDSSAGASIGGDGPPPTYDPGEYRKI